MDLSILESIQISDASLMWIGITIGILFLIPLVYAFVWRKKCGKNARFKALLIGGLGFIVSARILELGVHMFCIVQDNPISRTINASILLYVLYGITMAGVFEEVGRYIILRYFVKRDNTLTNAVMYGIGHGGIEVWVISMAGMISYLVIGIMFRSLPLADIVTSLNLTEDTIVAALPTLQSISSFGPGNALAAVGERVFCMFIHIGLTMIVYAAVKLEQKKYLILSIGLHMLIDTLPALAQKASTPQVITEAWVLAGAVLIMVAARKITKGIE